VFLQLSHYILPPQVTEKSNYQTRDETGKEKDLKLIETEKIKEKAILIGLITPGQDKDKANEYLDELEFLLETAGGVTVHRFLQKANYPDPKSFVGSGKLQEIKNFVAEYSIDVAIFDEELSPAQFRNLENELECKILDRTNLILDIFAYRARTSYAMVQVELAQYQYLLPRLTRMWTHLSKQKGGIGMKGPGEKEIETDRRIIRDKISLLKEKLKQIDKQQSTQRQNREGMVRVALVGYTNVGKSTLMNILSKSKVFAENKLFATLDTTVRKVVIHNLPFLLSDTVGFIRKLPVSLVESFKSTLDEVREADILIHIVDISHPGFEEQIEIVAQTLTEIGAGGKTTFLIFNKTDAFKVEKTDPDDLTGKPVPPTLEELGNTWMAKMHAPCIFISALKKQNIDQLKESLYQEVKRIHITRYPYDHFLY
jgi:GTP-binding protein HflX